MLKDRLEAKFGKKVLNTKNPNEMIKGNFTACQCQEMKKTKEDSCVTGKIGDKSSLKNCVGSVSSLTDNSETWTLKKDKRDAKKKKV